MKAAIDETDRRRELQEEFNQRHGITPTDIQKSFENPLGSLVSKSAEKASPITSAVDAVAPSELPKILKRLRREMSQASKLLEFERAIELRERIKELEIQQLQL